MPHSASFSHFYTPTLGLSLEKKLMRVDNSEVTVCIWDTAGQEKFLSLTNSYYKKADGVLVVFDLTDKNTFDSTIPSIQEWINSGFQNCGKNPIATARRSSSATNAIWRPSEKSPGSRARI